MTRVVHVAVVLGMLLWARTGLSQSSSSSGPALLEQARIAHFELDYTKAGDLLEKSRRAGDHDRASLAQVYGLSGRIAAAHGQVDVAYEHYRRMLVLGGSGLIGDGLAPKIVKPFRRAHADLAGKQGIVIRVVGGGRTTVDVAVVSDPLGMVAGAEATLGRRSARRGARATLDGGVAKIRLPANAKEHLRIYAIDRFGNRVSALVWRHVQFDEATAAVSAKRRRAREPETTASGAEDSDHPDVLGRRSPERRDRPLYAKWRVWGTAALGAGAAAVYFGLRANDDWSRLDKIIETSSNHGFDDAQRLERSGRRNQLYSNVGTGAALGLAGVSLYLLVRGDRSERPGLGASINGQGASVSLRGRF